MVLNKVSVRVWCYQDKFRAASGLQGISGQKESLAAVFAEGSEV